MRSLEIAEIVHQNTVRLIGDLQTEHNALHLPGDLILAGQVCGRASSLLLGYLEESGIDGMSIQVAKPESLPRTWNFRRLSHTVLVGRGVVVDATYGQFFGLVGLDARRAVNHPELQRLYPAQPIAIIEKADIGNFALGVAEHAISIRGTVRAMNETIGSLQPPEAKALADVSDDELRKVFAGIWDLSQYVDTATYEKREARADSNAH